MNMSDFIKQLNGYIRAAFDNEEQFLERFWGGGGSPELLECYMASERTRIVCLVSSGDHIGDTIRTDEFIQWCEQVAPPSDADGVE